MIALNQKQPARIEISILNMGFENIKMDEDKDVDRLSEVEVESEGYSV